ncbi:MAG TPA: hypothetical protein VND93_30785, partial [Myxococcales bacterium]|nr:hypothetical protein [Myxococcales bacterium]
SEQPHLEKLWAGARIKDAELELLRPERAPEAEVRIRKLALQHGVASRFTSFVVVEEREGARVSDQPLQTRVVPVHLPAGWKMFERREELRSRARLMGKASGGGGAISALIPKAFEAMARLVPGSARPAPSPVMAEPLISPVQSMHAAPPSMESAEPASAAQRLLERQRASGLWGEGLEETAEALLELRLQGVDTSHPVHGAQVRKAIAAVLAALPGDGMELALCAAWLAAAGKRTRAEVEQAARAQGAWAWLGDGALTERRAEELLAAIRRTPRSASPPPSSP